MLRLEDRRAPPQEAIVATGRKLAVIMHAIWRDGTSMRIDCTPTACRTARRRRRIASFWCPYLTLGDPFNPKLARDWAPMEIRSGG